LDGGAFGPARGAVRGEQRDTFRDTFREASEQQVRALSRPGTLWRAVLHRIRTD
jgi:hypothetical protein